MARKNVVRSLKDLVRKYGQDASFITIRYGGKKNGHIVLFQELIVHSGSRTRYWALQQADRFLYTICKPFEEV